MGLLRLQSFVCEDELRAICLRAAPGGLLFPATSATSRSTVPRTLRSGFILSCFHSPSKFLRRTSWPPCGDLSCLGSDPHRGVTEGVHYCRGAPALATFRPQVFATSRRLPPPFAVRACFIPLPRPGFLRSGVYARLAGAAARRRDLAPLPFGLARWPLVFQLLLAGDFLAATFEPVDFEALLRDSMRFVSWLFKPAPDRSPLRFFLPQACATSP